MQGRIIITLCLFIVVGCSTPTRFQKDLIASNQAWVEGSNTQQLYFVLQQGERNLTAAALQARWSPQKKEENQEFLNVLCWGYERVWINIDDVDFITSAEHTFNPRTGRISLSTRNLDGVPAGLLLQIGHASVPKSSAQLFWSSLFGSSSYTDAEELQSQWNVPWTNFKISKRIHAVVFTDIVYYPLDMNAEKYLRPWLSGLIYGNLSEHEGFFYAMDTIKSFEALKIRLQESGSSSTTAKYCLMLIEAHFEDPERTNAVIQSLDEAALAKLVDTILQNTNWTTSIKKFILLRRQSFKPYLPLNY